MKKKEQQLEQVELKLSETKSQLYQSKTQAQEAQNFIVHLQQQINKDETELQERKDVIHEQLVKSSRI